MKEPKLALNSRRNFWSSNIIIIYDIDHGHRAIAHINARFRPPGARLLTINMNLYRKS